LIKLVLLVHNALIFHTENHFLMKITELARITGAEIEGDSELELHGAAGLDDAKEGQVTFLSNPRYSPRVGLTKASAIFASQNSLIESAITVLRVKDPYLAYTRALRHFHPEPEFRSHVDGMCSIDPTASLHPEVYISAGVVIGAQVRIDRHVRIHPNVTIYERVSIGEGSIIHSGVSIREGTQIGARVVIQNNAVIGSDGFGYAKDEERHWLKIPQTGSVIIEDDVEIGACSTIDRASVGHTRIGRGTKIDNLVQVGHSCTIAEDTLLCAQVGLAGSSHIGSRVILAGQVGVAGHLQIGDDAVITAKSATSHDVPPGKVLSGVPAFDNKEWLRAIAGFRRLADMQRSIRQMEKRLKELDNTEP
jgi:UDP-3-O-[3-hydroxymyristoyl] glucosamine N-acyltransferase